VSFFVLISFLEDETIMSMFNYFLNQARLAGVQMVQLGLIYCDCGVAVRVFTDTQFDGCISTDCLEIGTRIAFD
jgi:hypothetical protein